jgi:hypothetical protein
MKKFDLKKTYKHLYNPSKKEPSVVEVPEFNFLMIDGMNANPDNEAFQNAIQSLFAMSYKLKFLSKDKYTKDYVVMPLEGLWWADDMNDFIKGKKENWKWTLMIMQPEFIQQGDVEEAMTLVLKKNPDLHTGKLRLESFNEGLSCQIMHIGPFSEEHENIMKIHRTITGRKGRFDGQIQKHHEIYLSDFRKTDPAKLRTVIRQAFNTA